MCVPMCARKSSDAQATVFVYGLSLGGNADLLHVAWRARCSLFLPTPADRWPFALLLLRAASVLGTLLQDVDGSLLARSPVDMGANAIHNVCGGCGASLCVCVGGKFIVCKKIHIYMIYVYMIYDTTCMIIYISLL